MILTFPGFPIKVSNEGFRSIFNNTHAYSTYIFRGVLKEDDLTSTAVEVGVQDLHESCFC